MHNFFKFLPFLYFLLIPLPANSQIQLEEKQGGGLHISGEGDSTSNQNQEPADNTPEQKFYSAPDVIPTPRYRPNRRGSSQNRNRGKTVKGDHYFNLVKSDCANKWGTDYDMQAYCINQEIKASQDLNKILKRYKKNSQEYEIFGKCSGKWKKNNGGFDMGMVLYCTKNQIEAYHNLNR